MPSPTEVANFQRLTASLANAAIVQVVALLDGTQDTEFLQDAYPQVIDPFISGAGTLAAEWYSGLAPESRFPVEVAPAPPASALKNNIRWALTQADVRGALSGSAERHVFTATRDTVLYNTSRENVRFARYASANACPWCRVLATREPTYRTADNAVKGHDGCHCIAVPVRNGDSYTPPDYVNQWTDEYNSARDSVGGNLNAIANHLRKTSPQGD
jgi:hypothetical protein